MASSFLLTSSLPHSFPSFLPLKLSFPSSPSSPSSSSTSSFSLSPTQNHHLKLTLHSSSPQFIQNPEIFSQNNNTHFPIFPSNPNPNFSPSKNAQILYQKCFHLLKLSIRYRDFDLARAVHSLVLKFSDYDDGNDNYLVNSLISAYVNLGLLNDAYDVFVGILNPDVVSYTLIISGFVKFGFEFDAIRVYFEMRDRGIEPNEFSFVALLNGCSRISELKLGLQVHCLVVKYGFLSNVYVANVLMSLYVKCGLLGYALQVFDEMPERDITSWNTVLSGLANDFMYERAFDLFREMIRVDGFRVDQFTLSSLLNTCAGCSARIHGREIHAHSLKGGFESNLIVNNALIGFYAKCGSAKHVRTLFESMPTKDVISWTSMISAYMEFGMLELAMDVFTKMPERNPVSFNAMLAGLCQNEKGFEALSLFLKMVSHGVELTESSLTSAITACSLHEEKSISEQIHGFIIKFGLKPNPVVEGALLEMCTRCGRMMDAEMMFYHSDYKQNLSVSWTSLLCAYARNGQPEEAIDLFHWGHSEEGMLIDDVIVTTILGICGTLGFYELGEQIHCHALKLGSLRDLGVGNAIISMYSKCGYMEFAIKVFNLMPLHDVVSFNCLISGHLLQRQGDEALVLWSRMKDTSLKPDSITLALVISSYKYTKSVMIDDCRSLFFSMKKLHGIEPMSDHYVSFISVLGHWGFLEEAEDIITQIPSEPKTSVWKALLHSCQIHMNSIIGKRIAKRILATQPQDPSTYILKSNLLSSSGRWHCSEIVRDEMREKGIRKHPTRSWIVHENKVHSFYVRDSSHTRSKDIQSGLKILILECLKAGYVPDTSYVLHEVEEYQKTDFLFYHSAKLAVTYGLLTSKRDKPIRVTKNVLLCGDCHNFFKYVTRVTRREICVRDTSGFHHFFDGKCSCKDHW